MSKRLREMRLSRARAARAEKPAAAPDPIVQFAKEAHDLDAIRKSVEDAAAVSAGFWLSYLFVLFYIGIAVGAVTHKDLLLESPVKLPFLSDVPLPLIAFFFLAPIVFIVSHTYTLVHFVMLAAKVGVFDTELRVQLGDAPETREGLRRQLPSNIFVQVLAGPGDIRKGGLGLILKAIAWFSLVIGPVLLLLLIQVQFLPYHLEWVTWVQRFAVLVDVSLLWALWPAVLNGNSEIKWSRLWRHPVLTFIGLVPVGLAFTAATFPGEWADEWIGNRRWIPPNPLTAWLGPNPVTAWFEENDWTSLHDLLFNGKIDDVTRRPKSLFSNTLVLPGFDALEAAKIDDPKKLDTVRHTLTLRGRHLESAVFNSADLRKADLTGAYLQGARLAWAQLQGATLDKAQLQGVGANFAKLQGASLQEAHFQGSYLGFTQLQGAMFTSAMLSGVVLKGAELQGAVLNFAQLRGASLRGAQLQGADFQESTLAGTNMGDAAVWRANFEGASLAGVFEDGLQESALSQDEFATLNAMIIKEVPEGHTRKTALELVDPRLNPHIFGPETSVRDTLKAGRVGEAKYQTALADELKSLACSGDENALYIVRGLIIKNLGFMETGAKNLRLATVLKNRGFTVTSAQAPGLVDAILKPDCPVSAALTEQDKAALKKLAKEASGPH